MRKMEKRQNCEECKECKECEGNFYCKECKTTINVRIAKMQRLRIFQKMQ